MATVLDSMKSQIRFASRMGDLGTETAFVVLARARQLEKTGRSVIHLEIGEPDFDTPKHIIQEAVNALQHGATHYGPAAGLPETREAIARYVHETRGVDVTPDWVVVTPGAKPIMFFTILALVNPGDEVIYPNPGFPIYESAIRFVGGRPVAVELREQNDSGSISMSSPRRSRSHETHHHQLPAQSDRGHAHPSRP